MDEFSWLDVQPGKTTGLENKATIMRDGAFGGKDRIWWSNGDTIWFRRSKSNPDTLRRHNDFVAKGDYKHIETQGDVEVYELQISSPFKTKRAADEVPEGTIDIGMMDFYNLRRQAALAACRRDFATFYEIMQWLRQKISGTFHDPKSPGMTPLAEKIYAEQYDGVMAMVKIRYGPTPQEINRECNNLRLKRKEDRQKIISIGKGR